MRWYTVYVYGWPAWAADPPSSFSFSPFFLCLPFPPLSLSLYPSSLSFSLTSYPKYRIMTQFSWAARASWEMVTIATAPVLLSRPTAACASARSIVLAMLAKSFWVLFVLRVCVYVCAYSGSGGGRGNRQMSLFAFFSLSSHQSQCSLRLSKYCSNHINILCTSAFRAAVQRAHEVISGSLQWLMFTGLRA